MTVLPVYNVLALPGASIYLKTELCRRMTGRMPQVDEKVMLLPLRENIAREQIREDSFYPIGVAGVITELNAVNKFFVVRTNYRVSLDEVHMKGDGSYEVTLSRRRDEEDLIPAEEDERLARVKSEIMQLAGGAGMAQGASRAYIAQLSSIAEVACAISPWMPAGSEERYAPLALDSQRERSEFLEKMILENIARTKVTRDAKSAQEEDYQKIYRESAIKKQMEYLQKELDEMHPEQVTDIRRLEIAVQESGMNEQARQECDKVLSRLRQEGKNSPESGMLYDYLETMTRLSWKKEDPETISLEEAEQVLNEDHYGLEKVKRRIMEQIAVMNLRKMQSGSILCFVGAPGTGKTSIGQSIAKALHRQYVRVSLGGVRDEADIRGHRRTYIGSMPGRIMDGIRKSGVSNPVMVLDEIDKLSQSYNGDPASALLEVLDPEQNHTFTDHYLNVPYDLSDVLFICTANTLDTIPAPLLDRMEVIRFQGYTPIEKEKIARQHLLPRAMKKVGIEEGKMSLTDAALDSMIRDYTREAGVRGLKKCMDMLCRACAVRIVRGEGETLTVDAPDLRELLDTHPVRHRHVPESAAPGVVTGLAWTPVGGEILYIETLASPGEGKVTITGQLGDVMKESAQLAMSLTRHLLPEQAKDLEKSSLHIHVPDGATPKDGPSAGITLTTALSSLVTGIPVPPDIAMTGEVSLRGTVGAIGGLPEKLMAAERAGVSTVFIPQENEDDLRDVPKEVLDHLAIIPVGSVAEVLHRLGLSGE